jgi:hypothetical protein
MSKWIDGLEVLDDGESVRAGRRMINDSLRDHMPHHGERTVEDATRVRDARDAWVKDLNNSWRNPPRVQDAETGPTNPGPSASNPGPGADDPQARRDAAYNESVDRVQNAWKR